MSACAHQNVTPARVAVARTAATTEEAFEQLAALRRQAQQAPNPAAAWSIYHTAWEHSQAPLRDFIAQVMAALQAELGLYEEAVRDYPATRPALRHSATAFPLPEEFRAEPAADAIADLAQQRQLVIVNEAHHVAESRWLSLQLLPRLRALGFTHFAAETLDPRDRTLAQRGYPTDASGYYSREPLYGELLRQALALGYTVIGYEADNDSADRDERERLQARNLFQHVFAREPQARLLVHAGYAHAHEHVGYLWNTPPMAQQLAQLSGLDPLSVDQTLLRPSTAATEYGAYAALLQAYAPTQPILLRSRHDGTPWSLEPRFYDISVILPRAELHDSRPGWLTLAGQRTPVAVDTSLCAAQWPCLIEARYHAESDAAVPADRWLLREPAAPATLFLAPGRYRLRGISLDNRLLGLRDLQVSLQSVSANSAHD